MRRASYLGIASLFILSIVATPGWFGDTQAGANAAQTTSPTSLTTGPQATVFESWGVWWDVYGTDTSTRPGVTCRKDGSLKLAPILVYGNPLWSFQSVRGKVTRWETKADGTPVKALERTTASALVGYRNQPDLLRNLPSFDEIILFGTEKREYLRVSVEITWYAYGDSYLENPVGGVSFWLDHYANERDGSFRSYCRYPTPAPTPTSTRTATPIPLACAVNDATVVYQQLVTVTCGGFKSGEFVALHWDATSSTPVATFTVDSKGSGKASFKIPRAVKGSHKVVALGQISGRRAAKSLQVDPKLTFTPRTGAAGTRITVRLYGFAQGEQVLVRWYRTATGWSYFSSIPIVIGADGYGAKTFTVPRSASLGAHKTEAVGDEGSIASGQFTVDSYPLPTATPTRTATATPTATKTATATSTATPVPSATATPTIEPTETSTSTPIPTETATGPPEPGPTETPALTLPPL